MTSKTLYTLGDSFMTVDYPPGGITSFLESYAERKQFQHISLGRAGATNFMIRLQIEQAIHEHADYVVVATTCSDRFDVALDPDELFGEFGLQHILHTGYGSASEKNVQHANLKIISDTFVNIERQSHEKIISQVQRHALKNYVTNLHSVSLANQKDYYIISDGLRKLQSVQIPFVFLPSWMWYRDWSWVQRTWPKDQPEPVNMPQGHFGWDESCSTVTHNPQQCHDQFCETLMSITQDWT
jgi:hypothetical protein